jgi:hypothetical protein
MNNLRHEVSGWTKEKHEKILCLYALCERLPDDFMGCHWHLMVFLRTWLLVLSHNDLSRLTRTDGFKDGLTDAKVWFSARLRSFLFFHLVDFLRRRGVAPRAQGADHHMDWHFRSALSYIEEAFARCL